MKTDSASKLIVMLTNNDVTVKNANELFTDCHNLNVSMWGIKDTGLPLSEMKRLFKSIKAYGKTAVLEVVKYDEAGCIAGAKAAVECRCDILMGTKYFESVQALCKANGIKYMPFLGKVSQHPSVLDGTVTDIISEARQLTKLGVDGFDLLGYRYSGDGNELNKKLVQSIKNLPVVIAGSVNSYERLNEVHLAAPWAFTIGSAFFDNDFGTDVRSGISNVADYIEKW